MKQSIPLRNLCILCGSAVNQIYRIVLTNGMKGCYVYFVDKETEKAFRERLGKRLLRGARDAGKFKVKLLVCGTIGQ